MRVVDRRRYDTEGQVRRLRSGLAPTTAGCSRSMLNRAAVKRAGKVAIGWPMAFAIWRRAEHHWARCWGKLSSQEISVSSEGSRSQ
jgi:hypothetical protein